MAQTGAQQPSSKLVAAFMAAPTSGVAPLTVRFTDTSTGSPAAWTWHFGDGATATGRTPSHIYQTAGTYTVSLLVTSPAGTNTLTKTNDIVVNAPRTIELDDHHRRPIQYARRALALVTVLWLVYGRRQLLRVAVTGDGPR